MSILPIHAIPGYQIEATPDLSRLETRKRLSRSAIEGFLSIVDKWGLSRGQADVLLGRVPRSNRLKAMPTTLRQDELMRISYVVAIYKALHIQLPDKLADQWMTRPNDNFLFRGQTPLDYVVRAGIPGLQQVRSLVDAARGTQ